MSIEVADDGLTIAGERRFEHRGLRRAATSCIEARLRRVSGESLTIPDGVDAEAVTAAFDEGRPRGARGRPKPEVRKPRRVAIKVGDATPTLEGSEKA